MISLPLPQNVLEAAALPLRCSAAVEKKVEEIWQCERARRSSLFNGKIFAVTNVQEAQIVGRFVEYKQFLAQLRCPELFEELKIEALAVTGTLLAEGGVIWGKREASSTQYPETWELLPSGGLDDKGQNAAGALDLRRQLLDELKQELGLGEESVDLIRPICFVHDAASHLYNFAMELQTPLAFAQIIQRHSVLPNREHSELRLVLPHGLSAFLTGLPPAFAELSRTILSHGSLGDHL